MLAAPAPAAGVEAVRFVFAPLVSGRQRSVSLQYPSAARARLPS